MIPAVIYAAKSTEDRHASIPTQLEDARRLAKDQDWEVVGEFQDEGFSAYSGNRGQGLAQAREVAQRLGTAEQPCYLVAQHSDRFARGAGDAPDAADHLMEIFFWANRHNVRLWTKEEGELDSTRAFLSGMRNEEDSRRKAAATRAGLHRRKERGQPVGPVPFGYRVDRQIVGDTVITSRVADPVSAPIMVRAFTLVADGYTPGEAARILNADGLRTRRGKPWSARALRGTLRNDSFLGRNGYPLLVTQDVFDRVQRRLDERRQDFQKLGGYPAKASYLLKGLCSCGQCGKLMYIRTYLHKRTYVCGNVNSGTGVCNSEPLDATVLETAVLNRLEHFVGDIETWVYERLAEQQEKLEHLKQKARRGRQELLRVEERMRRAQQRYDQVLDAGDDGRAAVIEQELARLRHDSELATAALQQAEAQVEEWSAEPDPQAAREWLAGIWRQISGKIREAEGSEAVRAAIRSAVADIIVRKVEAPAELLIDIQLRAEAVPTIALTADREEQPSFLNLHGGRPR